MIRLFDAFSGIGGFRKIFRCTAVQTGRQCHHGECRGGNYKKSFKFDKEVRQCPIM